MSQVATLFHGVLEKSSLFALNQVFEEILQLLLLFGVQGTCVELYGDALLAVTINL
ncbi:hypothetical protein [Methylotuvimicrobium alcaliphilum]|uniref:hypothetical protein n=1 Tax=Methylotuvimicrobium alcaliphilum TaxID=271065 RepID=UPI00139243DB|nr:hypothetical protein [Methylotuvimicrobium alcaliphilum]